MLAPPLPEANGASCTNIVLDRAAVCLAGSLYFSEVAHFPPCHLCWLQRFCMYPLVPILGFAAWRHATRVWNRTCACEGRSDRAGRPEGDLL